MDPSVSWIRRLFRQYYRSNAVYVPPRFTRREYGFMFVGEPGMQRHLAFRNRQDVVKYLADKGPAHSYYSTAYYDRPDATKMADKGWKGADLIFDLDADHLPGAKGQSFESTLARVRDEAVHVVQEFLLGHFGFQESDIRVAFSGGRGYHIHVTHPDVIPLEADARREIVSYVTGNGLDVERLVRKRAVARRGGGGAHESYDEMVEIPDPSEPGWRGLVARSLELEFRRYAAAPEDEVLAELQTFKGVGAKRAEDALRLIQKGASVKDVAARLPVTFTRSVVERVAVAFAGEADEPVTADVKRLIRLPGSLHGKTGLRVTPISISELPDFDPLVQAVALPDDEVKVDLPKAVAFTINDQGWELPEGPARLPTYAAAMLVMRRQATYLGAAS